jgi:hypothetical protein
MDVWNSWLPVMKMIQQTKAFFTCFSLNEAFVGLPSHVELPGWWQYLAFESYPSRKGAEGKQINIKQHLPMGHYYPTTVEAA